MSSDESDCPLCLEPMDSDDASFYPCPCLYQVCRFCWAKILNEENGLCPACRQPYDSEAPAVFVPQNNVTEHKRKPSKRKKETQTKAHISKDTLKMLPELRVIQTNLVFVVGLPQWISKDKEILKNVEYFGQFGKVFKVEVNPNPNFTNPQECMYLHDLGDPKASFTKEQMQAGKHTEYMNELLQSFVAQMSGQQQQQQQQSEGGQAGDQRHSLPPDQISPSTAAASATATDKSSATSSHSQPSSSREYAPHSEAPRNCLRRRGAGCSGPASNRNSRHEVSARTGFAGSGGTRHLAGSFSLEGEPPFSKSAVAATSLSTPKAFHPNKVDCRPRPGSDGSLSLFPPPESKDADQNATSTPAQPAPPFMHANDLSSSPADFSGGNYSNYDHHSEDPGADVAFGAPAHSPSSATATVDASQCLRPRRVMDNSDSAQPPGSTGLNDQPPVGAIAADIDFDPIRESQQGLAELLAAEMNYPDLRSGYKKLLPSGGGGSSSSGAGHLKIHRRRPAASLTLSLIKYWTWLVPLFQACLTNVCRVCDYFLKLTVFQECMYLHDLGDPKASFTKEQMQAGKHTEYMNELLQSFVAQMAGQQQQQQQSEGGQAGDQRHSLPPDQISPSTAAASATATDKSSATSSHSQPSSSNREYAPHSEAPRNCPRRRGAGCSGPASNRNSRHEVSGRTGFAGSGGTRHLAGSFSLEGEPPFSKSAVAATSLSTLKAFHPNKVDCRPRPGSDGSLSLFPPPESKDADQNATSTSAQPAPPFMHANDLSSSPADFSGGNYSNYDHHSEDPGADVAFGAPDHSPSSSATATVDASQCLRPRRVMDNSDSAQPPGSTGLNDQPPVGAIAADIDFDPIRESQQGLAELLAAEMNYPDLRSGYKKLLPSGGGGSSSGAGHLFAGFNADNSGRKTGGPDTQISLSTQTPLIFSPPPGFEESSNRTPPEDAVLLPFVAQQIAAQLDCPSTASSLLPPLLSTSEFGAIYTQLLESVCCNRTAVTTASDTASGISARDGPPFADPAVINATTSASPSPSPSFNPLAASADPMVAACLLAYQNLLAVAQSNQNARLVPSWDGSKTAADPSAAGAADHLLTELSQRLLECARLSFRDGGAEDPASFDQQQQLSFSNFSGNLHIPGLTNGCYNMDLGLDGQSFCLPGFNPDAFSKGRSVGSTTANLNNVWSPQDVTTSAPLAQPPPPPSHQQQPKAPNSASRQHDHHQGDEQCTDQGQPAASCSSTQPPSAGTGTSSSPSSSSSAFRNFPCEPFNQPISEYSSLSQPYACLPSSDLP
nr:unnamed protein product [Spirometra erinaceieuropaei]